MKHVYRVTRPAWAAMETWETAMITTASLLVGAYAAWGQTLAVRLLTALRVNTTFLSNFWPLVDISVTTLGCLLLLACYKSLRVGCYPSTFLYCFKMPEASNPSGKSQVVGYCQIK